MFGMYGYGAGYFGDGPDGTGTPNLPVLGPPEIVDITATFRRVVATDAAFRRTVNAEVTFRRRVDLEVER